MKKNQVKQEMTKQITALGDTTGLIDSGWLYGLFIVRKATQ